MKLSKEQIKQVQDALLSGYDEPSLRMMVRIELGEDLEEIAGGDALTLRVLVFNLIDWAERCDRVFELIDGARAQQATNADVNRVWQASQQWRQPAGSETADDSTGVGADQFGENRGQPSPLVWWWIWAGTLLLTLFTAWFVANSLLPLFFRVIPTPSPVVESQITPSSPTSPGTPATDEEAIAAALPPTKTASTTITPTRPASKHRTNSVDGAIYVYVPAGPFIMGSDDADSIARDDEKPQQPDLYLDAFWIMQTEVTNAQYATCVEAGLCSDPGSGNTQWRDPTYVEYPVTHVDWYQASKYAQWAGGRLPTEAEWEKAARGVDGRKYPWGNDPPTGDLGNFGMNVGETTSVGTYPKGASPYGVLDMAGNVWEWTNSLYKPYPYDASDGRENPEGDDIRVLRGGSWFGSPDVAAASLRYGGDPDIDYDHGGIRVVVSSSP